MDAVEFRSHCDDPSCDLGTVRYTCPVCNRAGVDYGAWFDQIQLILDVIPYVELDCEHCRTRLVLYVHHDHEWVITTMEKLNALAAQGEPANPTTDSRRLGAICERSL